MWACFKPASGTVRTSENDTVETDCVAGHVRFELRNVVANYPFEKSRRFGGIQPNSLHRDHSRLSCRAGGTQLRLCANIPRRPRADGGHRSASLRWRANATIFGNPKVLRGRQNQQHHCLVCTGLSAQRTDSADKLDAALDACGFECHHRPRHGISGVARTASDASVT